MALLYVHFLMSYKDLRATINRNQNQTQNRNRNRNRRSWKIKQYSKHLYNFFHQVLNPDL